MQKSKKSLIEKNNICQKYVVKLGVSDTFFPTHTPPPQKKIRNKTPSLFLWTSLVQKKTPTNSTTSATFKTKTHHPPPRRSQGYHTKSLGTPRPKPQEVEASQGQGRGHFFMTVRWLRKPIYPPQKKTNNQLSHQNKP